MYSSYKWDKNEKHLKGKDRIASASQSNRRGSFDEVNNDLRLRLCYVLNGWEKNMPARPQRGIRRHSRIYLNSFNVYKWALWVNTSSAKEILRILRAPERIFIS